MALRPLILNKSRRLVMTGVAESIVTAGAPAIDRSPVPAVAPVAGPHELFDAERFSRLLEASTRDRPEPFERNRPDPGHGSNSLGDKLLTGMAGMGSEFKHSWREVSSVVEAPGTDVSLQDLMRVQLHLVRVAVQYEAMGKAIGKSTQNIDQLVRMQ
jgi:hypothetical protein